MTIEELNAMGFGFDISHYRYRVEFTTYVGPASIQVTTIANVSYRLPDSKAAMFERARRDALTYFMAERLK